jgi:hypothetical protein
MRKQNSNRNIRYLILHVSGNSNLNLRAQCIQDYFLRPKAQGGKGWSRGGYHKIIEGDGDIFTFYGDSDVTFGVKPFRDVSNSNSLHVCTIGGINRSGKPIDNRTAAQRKSQERVIQEYTEKYPNIKILGHNQVDLKPCPCYSVPKFLQSIGIPDKFILFDDFRGVLKANGY